MATAAVEDELAEKRRQAAGGESEAEQGEPETGAEALPEPDYAAMSEEARRDAYQVLLDDGMAEAEAKAKVWPETPAEAEAKPPKLLQEALPGDWTTISGEFGGADPETSEIRLLGGKMPIEGSFAKGTEIDLLVRVRVTGVLGQDVLDDFGRTTRTVRRHMARMVSVQRANR